MAFRSSTPYDLAHEPVLCQREFDDNFFDQYLNLDESCQLDATILAVDPRSPQLATAPSPSHSQASGFESTSYLSHRFAGADSNIGYWSNYSRPPSPVGRGRSKTFGEHQLLRTRPDSGALEHDGVAYQSPPIYTLDSSPPSPTSYKPVTSSPHNIVQSLRRKKSFNHRSASSIRSAREPSRERDPCRSARSVSRSAIRKQSSPPKMSKSSSAAYAQVTIEEWNAKLTQQAQQFDFGFPQSLSPPPSARVSDASSSESTKMRTKALTQQRRQQQQQQQQRQQHEQQYQQQQQTEQWQAQQYAVVRNSHMLTPLTTRRYHESSLQQNHNASFMSEPSQWTTTELQDMNGSFVDMSFVVDGDMYWEEPAQMSEQETSPVVLSHNESFPQPMAASPISSRNTKQLQITLPPNEQRPDWPTIDTSVNNGVNVNLTISPGVRPTPIGLTNGNHFASHAHTQSLPNIGNSMLLQPHVSMPPSPTRGRPVPDGGEPSPLRHRESGSYFSNVAPPPMPAYLQSQQASPMLSQHSSPMRVSKTRRRQMENDDYSSPPSRSVSPASFSRSLSQSFPNALGIQGIHNASTSNFSTPHPHPHPYGLSVRKSGTLSHRTSEPSFAPHHQRGRSSLSYSHPFPVPSGSPSPRQSSQSRAKMHSRSKSSNNLRSTSSKRSSSKKGKDAGVSMAIEFHNYTPKDGSRILSGVAPSGSSKTKARREKEAREKQRRLSLMAVQAVRDLGGDPGHYLGEGLDSDMNDGSGEDGMDLEVEMKAEEGGYGVR